MLRVFVTGGSGFLGQKLISSLIQNGHQVMALSRSQQSDKTLSNLGASVTRGDLQHIDEWKHCLKGCDIFFHLAAPVIFWGNWPLFQQDIVDASLSCLKACDEYLVDRFIYSSSESVMQESMVMNSNYAKAKKISEQLLLSAELKHTKRIIFRLPLIWGKNCEVLNILKAKIVKKQFIWVSKGKSLIETIHVNNAVWALMNAMVLGDDAAIFLLSDELGYTFKQFFEKFFQSSNIKLPKYSLPRFVLLPIAYCLEVMWKLFKIKSMPPLTLFELDFASISRQYNIEKTKKILSYHSVTDYDAAFLSL